MLETERGGGGDCFIYVFFICVHVCVFVFCACPVYACAFVLVHISSMCAYAFVCCAHFCVCTCWIWNIILCINMCLYLHSVWTCMYEWISISLDMQLAWVGCIFCMHVWYECWMPAYVSCKSTSNYKWHVHSTSWYKNVCLCCRYAYTNGRVCLSLLRWNRCHHFTKDVMCFLLKSCLTIETSCFCLETCESWSQVKHPTIQNIPQWIPFEPWRSGYLNDDEDDDYVYD